LKVDYNQNLCEQANVWSQTVSESVALVPEHKKCYKIQFHLWNSKTKSFSWARFSATKNFK